MAAAVKESQGHEDGYTGAVTLVVDGHELHCEATLRGHFEPLDGRYHWYGRLAVNPELTEPVGTSRRDAALSTSFGTAIGQLGDVDTWGRYRVSGISTPPFRIALTLADVEQEHETSD
jgi:hypothetical protein